MTAADAAPPEPVPSDAMPPDAMPPHAERPVDFAFAFHGEALIARASGTLWWPARRLLAVGDLHFGKAQRYARARSAGLLPPYEMRETLTRLSGEIDALDPAEVVALGDSFDDAEAEARMLEADALWLARLMAGRNWIWVAGNHDPGPVSLGGSLRLLHKVGPLTFRHIAAEAPEAGGEVSGHYHPKARLAGISAPCFLIDRARLILPAFGAYTGGLECSRPPLAELMGPQAIAVLTGRRARAIPMPRVSTGTTGSGRGTAGLSPRGKTRGRLRNTGPHNLLPPAEE